jgi:hypothetical protein
MVTITERCHVCDFTEEHPNLRAPNTAWTRPGLCRACAGLGYDWSPCRPCGRPIMWCETVNGKNMPVDCHPPASTPPNLVITPGSKKPQARHAHPEHIRLTVVPGGNFRSGVAHHATCTHGRAMRRT